ncbi:MAG: transposase [Candidatus Ratteibacteria bacterium]|nr:transposase [Candidatus Ratteibacteria bacterium]
MSEALNCLSLVANKANQWTVYPLRFALRAPVADFYVMNKKNKFYTRRNNRLKGHDYTSNGYYYVTICTNNRKELFGRICDNKMELNNAGENDKLLNNGQAQRPVPTDKLSLSDIIHRFKTITTKKYIDGVKNDNWKSFNKHLWQRSFHDHIIRNDKSLNNIREYIINNPATWEKDENDINIPVGTGL